MARRQHLTLTVILALIVFFSITYLFSGSSTARHVEPLKSGRDAEVPLKPADPKPAPASTDSKSDFKIDLDAIPNLSEGDSIAPKLENATLKSVSPTVSPPLKT